MNRIQPLIRARPTFPHLSGTNAPPGVRGGGERYLAPLAIMGEWVGPDGQEGGALAPLSAIAAPRRALAHCAQNHIEHAQHRMCIAQPWGA